MPIRTLIDQPQLFRFSLSTLKKDTLPRSRRPEAAGRTRTQATVGGPAAEGTHRRSAHRAIETQSKA